MPFEDGKPDLAIPSGGHFEDEPSSSLWRRLVADPAISLIGKGAISVPETAVGIADLVTGGYAGKAAEAVGFRPKEAKEYLDTLLSPEQQEANRYVQEAEGFFPTIGRALERPSTIAHSVLESLPSVGAGGVVARGLMKAAPKLAPLVAGAAGEGTVSAGQTAEQIRQVTPTGTISLPQIALAAGSGAATMGFGVAGGKLAHRLNAVDIDTLIAGGKLPEGARKSLARRIGEGIFIEGPIEELPQSLQEQIAQNLALGEPWQKGTPQAGAMGMLAGSVMGGGVATLTPTKPPVQEILDRNPDSRKAAEELLQKAAEDVIQGTDTLAGNKQETPNESQQLPAPGEQAAPETTPEAGQAQEVTPISGAMPKTVGGIPVSAQSVEQLRAIAQDPEANANTRRAALAALDPPVPPVAESQVPVAVSGESQGDRGVAPTQEGGLPEVAMAVQDIPTTEKMRLAIEAVGEDEFRRQAQAKIEKYKPINPKAEAMLVEATATEILAQQIAPADKAEVPPVVQNVDTSAQVPTVSNIAPVSVQEPVIVYRGAKSPEGSGALTWYTTEKSAAQEYALLDEGGKVTKTSIKGKKLASPAQVRRIAAKIGLEIPEDQSAYSILAPEQFTGANRLLTAVKAAGFDGVHLPPGENFAPSGKPIESVGLFRVSAPAEVAQSAEIQPAPAAQPSPAVPKPQPGAASPVEPVIAPEKPAIAPKPEESRQIVETFTGQYKKGLGSTVARQQQKRLSAEKPTLTWEIEPAPEFGEQRFKLVGYGPTKVAKKAPTVAEKATISPEGSKVAISPEGDADLKQAETAKAPAKSGKPRMGETADELYAALRKAANGVVDTEGRGGIVYPVIRLPAVGGTYRMESDGSYVSIGNGGMTATPATKREIADIENGIETDTAQVEMRSRWGGSGSDTSSKFIKTLHSPSGNSWGQAATLTEAETVKSEAQAESAAEPTPPAPETPAQPAPTIAEMSPADLLRAAAARVEEDTKKNNEAVQAAEQALQEQKDKAEQELKEARVLNPPIQKTPLTVSAIPEGTVITLPVKVEATGEVHDVEFDAREMFKESERKVKRLQSLLECVRSA